MAVPHEQTIHTAFCYQRRNRQFRASAYVGAHRRPMHSMVTGFGQTADEAVAECVEHIRRIHEREGLTCPKDIVHHGRVQTAVLENRLF